jgi:hypothetical protein
MISYYIQLHYISSETYIVIIILDHPITPLYQNLQPTIGYSKVNTKNATKNARHNIITVQAIADDHSTSPSAVPLPHVDRGTLS